MYFDNSPLLSFVTEKNYPQCRLDENGRVGTSRITKATLIKMITEVETAMKDKSWTATTQQL